jgi:hypothetical protein
MLILTTVLQRTALPVSPGKLYLLGMQLIEMSSICGYGTHFNVLTKNSSVGALYCGVNNYLIIATLGISHLIPFYQI